MNDFGENEKARMTLNHAGYSHFTLVHLEPVHQMAGYVR